MGDSNGDLVGAQQCWNVDKIKNALLINGPLMINWPKTKKGAEEFRKLLCTKNSREYKAQAFFGHNPNS